MSDCRYNESGPIEVVAHLTDPDHDALGGASMADQIVAEEWRPVVGYEGWYSVSNLGRVRRDRASSGAVAGRPLQLHTCAGGGNKTRYVYANLSRHNKSKSCRVHVLVARAFLGNCPPGHQVNHIDGCSTNNNLLNLEYVTPRENVIHFVTLFAPTNAILNPDIVKDIRRRLANGETRVDVARSLGVAWDTIRNVDVGRTWRHVA